MYVKFSGSCLKQDKVIFNHKKSVNIYFAYDLKSTVNNFDPTLQNCLFEAVKFTKNSDIDKYQYSGYGIRFDSKGTFTNPSDGTGVNVIIFGANLSSSTHVKNKTSNKKHFNPIYGDKMYSVNFTATRKKIYLSLHYNGDDSYLFVNGTEITKFEAKHSEIIPNPICLGNISEGFSVSDMKKTRSYGSVTFFGFSPSNSNSLQCVSMKNQECKINLEIINLNTNETVFYHFSIKVNKCSGSCNSINDPYAKLSVTDVVKNINVKVFSLMPRINETRHIIWNETCKCICRLSASVCNNRKRWNEDKCRCECKELIDKGICDK